ncbi:hypothetical protein N0Y54_29665, partial [Nostoc punctiforme UO1]
HPTADDIHQSYTPQVFQLLSRPRFSARTFSISIFFVFTNSSFFWFFLTYYAKSIAKSVKISEQIYRKVNQVLVRLDIYACLIVNYK